MVTIVAPELVQHNFLDMAKKYNWSEVFKQITTDNTLINVNIGDRMTALHQAVDQFNKVPEPKKPPIQKTITKLFQYGANPNIIKSKISKYGLESASVYELAGILNFQLRVRVRNIQEHAFLDMAKDRKWDEVLNMLKVDSSLINVSPSGRMTAKAQAEEALKTAQESQKDDIQNVIKQLNENTSTDEASPDSDPVLYILYDNIVKPGNAYQAIDEADNERHKEAYKKYRLSGENDYEDIVITAQTAGRVEGFRYRIKRVISTYPLDKGGKQYHFNNDMFMAARNIDLGNDIIQKLKTDLDELKNEAKKDIYLIGTYETTTNSAGEIVHKTDKFKTVHFISESDEALDSLQQALQQFIQEKFQEQTQQIFNKWLDDDKPSAPISQAAQDMLSAAQHTSKKQKTGEESGVAAQGKKRKSRKKKSRKKRKSRKRKSKKYKKSRKSKSHTRKR